MIIIYQCYGGTHSSVVCAFIYTGLLPRDYTPSNTELGMLPYFDRLQDNDIGKLHYTGCDKRGNMVFCLGSKKWGGEIRKLINVLCLKSITGATEVALINCVPLLTPLMRIGGYISRRIGITGLGRPILFRTIRANYRRYIEQVQSFEKCPEKYIIN